MSERGRYFRSYQQEQSLTALSWRMPRSQVCRPWRDDVSEVPNPGSGCVNCPLAVWSCQLSLVLSTLMVRRHAMARAGHGTHALPNRASDKPKKHKMQGWMAPSLEASE